MDNKIDTDTRFYIDIDIKNEKILSWDYGNRYVLAQKLPNPNHCRIFITKGHYNKFKNLKS